MREIFNFLNFRKKRTSRNLARWSCRPQKCANMIPSSILSFMKFCVAQTLCRMWLHVLYGMRSSGLIPDNPRIVINKYTQHLMYIAERAIINWYPDWIHHSIYTSQVIYIMYCTMLSTDRDLEGRRWLHVEVGNRNHIREMILHF